MIIGITGRARSGKDTIANYLVHAHGFVRIAFADELKRMVNGLFGWEEKHGWGSLKDVVDPKFGFTPRRAYQLFGTDFIRALNKDFWLHTLERKGVVKDPRVVIPDVRYPNEAGWCRIHGVMWGVKRDESDARRVDHTSEAFVTTILKKCSVVFENNGSIDDLSSKIDQYLPAVF